MKILRTRSALIKWRAEQTQSVGFVPTMGALHEGHLSLVRRAKRAHPIVVASIFVNPTQFGPSEDFKKYPRHESADLKLLKSAGCSAVFLPRSVSEVYSDIHETSIKARPSLSSILCGRFRPGHFDGVVTVVYKLFRWVKPASAFFGEKDYQQLQIIKAMVSDLGVGVRVVPCPIVRESSGLAMSSRNAYLDSKSRLAAAEIYRILKTSQTLTEARRGLKRAQFRVQYLEAWSKDLTHPVDRKGRWLVAVLYRGVRLIDNLNKN